MWAIIIFQRGYLGRKIDEDAISSKKEKKFGDLTLTLSKPYHRASSFVREKTFITAKNGFSLFISYHMRTKWSLHWFSPRRIGDVPIINFWALSIEKETGKKSSGTHTATRAVVIVTWHMIVAFYTTITTWSGTICKSVECEELTSCQKSWFLLPRYKI